MYQGKMPCYHRLPPPPIYGSMASLIGGRGGWVGAPNVVSFMDAVYWRNVDCVIVKQNEAEAADYASGIASYSKSQDTSGSIHTVDEDSMMRSGMD